VNFCKFTNETRLAIEDASIHADYRQFLPWLKSRQQDWRTSQTLH